MTEVSSSAIVSSSSYDWDIAKRHIELVAGDANAKLWFRFFPDHHGGSGGARNLFGTLDECAEDIECAQAAGCGVFFVVNDGGSTDAAICAVRAAFIDSDGVPLGAVTWHHRPDFIVLRDPQHWHAYWRTSDVPVSAFRELQKRLAKNYGTDSAVCNPSRVLRLAGFDHLKNPNEPHRLRLIDYLGVKAHRTSHYTFAELLDGLPELTGKPMPAANLGSGAPITLHQFREWLSYIDPTFKGDDGTWVGMALAIRYGELPVVSREEIDWEQVLDDWCSGRLWAARTGDKDFVPSTYYGREELMTRVGQAF